LLQFSRLELTLLDTGLRRTWKRLLDGHCGIVNVNDRDERFKEVPCQIAAVVPKGRRKDGGWMAEEWLSRGVCFLFLKFATTFH
jgi:3-oxoacyl-[acyl-carrier-protein] synthase II